MFLNAFSWMIMYKFRSSFHWGLFPGVKLTIFQHWFRKWLGAGQATSHYLNQWWSVYWRTYGPLGLIDLTHWCLCKKDSWYTNTKLHVLLGTKLLEFSSKRRFGMSPMDPVLSSTNVHNLALGSVFATAARLSDYSVHSSDCLSAWYISLSVSYVRE